MLARRQKQPPQLSHREAEQPTDIRASGLQGVHTNGTQMAHASNQRNVPRLNRPVLPALSQNIMRRAAAAYSPA